MSVRGVLTALIPLSIMEANHPSTDASATFEHELKELIISAYGRGVTIEDMWEFPGPVSDAPNWRVTIEKVPPAERTYDPSLLEE
ncbi:hypothetical protein [Natrinema salinisoli]|uniref:hypothetical protein n=1 Tax=Natrinema salinisoli TaxID=2878535 RepID=UPI001CEFEEEE|nr:hypothetical protein [Natrinema salinisoli]